MLTHTAVATALATAPVFQFWWATGVTGVVGLGLGRLAFVNFKRKRLIEDIPLSKIRAAAQGYVKLQGVTELLDGDPIEAPLSLRTCVWFRYSIERREQSTSARGRIKTRWSTIERGVSEHIFALRDGSGRCVIDPDHAIVTPSQQSTWYGSSRIPPPIPGGQGWAVRLDLGRFTRDFRYKEQRIDLRAGLYALGDFNTHRALVGGANESQDVALLLREWKADRANLMRRFDTNHDGELSLDEWEQARLAAQTEIQQRHESTPPPSIDVLAASDHSDRPYLLAATTEHRLLSALSRRAVGFVICAMLCSLLIAGAASLRFAQ